MRVIDRNEAMGLSGSHALLFCSSYFAGYVEWPYIDCPNRDAFENEEDSINNYTMETDINRDGKSP